MGLGYEVTTIGVTFGYLDLPEDEDVTVEVDLRTYDSDVTGSEVVHHVEETTPVAIDASLDMDDSTAEIASSTTEAVSPGDEVSAEVTLQNPGDEEHTFFLSLTPRDKDGAPYIPGERIGKPVTLASGEQRTETVSWTVDTEISEGTYDIELAGWYESDSDELLNRLGESTMPDAFTVEKPDGELEVTTTPADATVIIDGELAEEAPVTVELPIGTYDLQAFREYSGTAETSVTVNEGETAAVSLDIGPAALPGSEYPPQDLNNDGLYEDIDGDGEFDIFDVQALFNHLDSDAVQNHPEAFNFNEDEDPGDVTIFDVQGLFNRLKGWDGPD